MKLLPVKVRTLIMNITPWKALHEVRDMVNYMHEISVEIYHEKKRALEEGDEAVVRQIGQGKDLLSILCEYLPYIQNSEFSSQICSEREYESWHRR